MSWRSEQVRSAATLVEVLDERVDRQPDRRVYAFLNDGVHVGSSLTFAELLERSRRVAAGLQLRGVRRGDRALLLYPQGLELLAAFFGCLAAGIVAVPLSPPHRPEMIGRLQSVFASARATAVLTDAAGAARFQAQFEAQGHPRAEWITTDELDTGLGSLFQPAAVRPDHVAFLQYTSGSTARPKGVEVRHHNLVHNLGVAMRGFGFSEESILVSWMPLTHDMGLILGALTAVFHGCQSYLMRPLTFIRRPARWLQAITRYRGTHSAAPNFGYEICLESVSAADRKALDLSSWSFACCGAEPIRRETLDRFAEAFAPRGFRATAFSPGYGLAEATLVVSCTRADEAPSCVSVDGAALERDRVVPMDPGSAGTRTLVGVGAPCGATVRIVDPETCVPCAADRVGEIWVRGDSIVSGYHADPASSAVFGAYTRNGEGPFLRTGDLGFIEDGSLVVVGRSKDLIIVRGRNVYPQDLELTVTQVDDRVPAAIAFGVDVDGSEQVVVVAEVRDARRTTPDDLAALRMSMREQLVKLHEVPVREVVLTARGDLPRTSSGKLQRSACRAAYLASVMP